MRIPKAIVKLIESFERLPGIGPKTAQRLTYYLFHVPQSELDEFATSLSQLKTHTIMCSTCFNIGEEEICSVCSDLTRDSAIICVVENPLDVIAIEKSGKYNGIYHVLHGAIDPLNNIGPDEIYIPQLSSKLKAQSFDKAQDKSSKVKEVILATNPTLEGEATAMYILNQLKSINSNIKVTRIGRGLPIGADLEYADEITIERALEGRREY